MPNPATPSKPTRWPRALWHLFEGAAARHHARGEYVYLPDDPATHVFLVRSGAVRLARLLDSGRELNLDIAGPGEIIGEGGVFGESCRHGLAQTLSPALVARVPSGWLASAAEGDAGTAMELAQIILERRLRMESRTVQNLSWGCGQRVGALLLELAERFGSLTPSGRNLGVRLTHEDVARFIGAARETVTPLLVNLRSEGVISYDRRNLIIRDPGRLREKGARPTPA